MDEDPMAFIFPVFRNLHEKRTDYIRGFGFQGGASRSGSRRNTETTIGSSLKDELTEPGGWSIGFTGFGECLPDPRNRVELNSNLKDKWGRNTLTTDAEFRDNEKNMHKDILVSMQEMLETAGFQNIKIEEGMSFPGNANHEMGTARMGRDPKTSVLNGFNQMHEVKNVFITDGSFMPSTSCVNPSLTYMAMTARAASHAVDELKKGNI